MIKTFARWRSPQSFLLNWYSHRQFKRSSSAPIQNMRMFFAKLDQRVPWPSDLRRIEIDTIPCDELGDASAKTLLLWLHGGGFCLRFPHHHAQMVSRIARNLPIKVMLPDYRLAPENPYPAAVEDVFKIYQSVSPQFEKIIVGGDSAGGNLALGLIHQIKAAGLPLPRCVILLSPATDLTYGSPSLAENESADPMFNGSILENLLKMYCPYERRREILASPLLGDLSGFPPLLFQVGSTEMLRDESLRFAEKAEKSGCSVEVQIWKNMIHVFQCFHFLPESGRAIRQIKKFILSNCDPRE